MEHRKSTFVVTIEEAEMSDRAYWDRFYQQDHPDISEPTAFARHCVSLLPESSSIFEIGCGNGRDAIFMARNGLRVFASDASQVAIDGVRERAQALPSIHALRLIAQPIELLDDRLAGELDAVYMRFILHAIQGDVASIGLRWAFRNLRQGGRLFVEARSVRGSLYGVGRPAGRDAFFQDEHYRRFIRLQELSEEIAAIGFRLDESVEAEGLAVHGSDNPVVIRLFVTRTERRTA